MRILNGIVYGIKSLWFRLALVIFILGAIPSLLVLLVYSNNYESRAVSTLTSNVTSQAQLISSQIVSGGYLSKNDVEGEKVGTTDPLSTRLNSLREMYVGRIMIMDSSMNILIDTYDIYDGRIMIWENALRSAAGETVSEYDRELNLLTVSVPIGTADDIANGNILGVIIISRNTDYISLDREYYDNLSTTIIIVVILVGIFISILVSYLLLLPINNLSEGVKELVDERRLKLDGSSASEINRISDSINIYTDKQRNVDSTLKDFISNVSHELKTPLTSMKIMADSLNASDNTPVEFYKEFMEDIASEIDRETLLINDLISLVKAENDRDLNFESINVNELIESIMKTLSPIAEKADVELLLETFKPVVVELDRVKFSQAMINLIENAIKYNNEGGYVHVSINSDRESCYIRVEDNGIGIPKDSLDQIFERFYRADTSHSKEIEGTGLGLSIVKNIVLLHNGQIKADSIEGQGSVFTVKLPLIKS